MSHFSVLIISTDGEDDHEDQLEPYYEGREDIQEYVRDRVSEDDKKRMVEYYLKQEAKKQLKEDNKDADVEVEIEVKIDDLEKQFADLYAKHGKDWNSGEYRFQHHPQTGELAWWEFSTYNPDSKWDWYEVGGRWAGSLLLKPEHKDKQNLNFSWGWKSKEKQEIKKTLRTDQALKKYLDLAALFGENEKEKSKAERDWLLFTGKITPKTDEDKEKLKRRWYTPEYFIKRYPTVEDYIADTVGFKTYALLIDGDWFEPGQMGWFGMSDETPASARDFDKLFRKKIEEAPDDALFTVVDCHI